MKATRSQSRAEQIAKLQAEQDAYDRSVKESVKAAAFARCAAVEELYEMLAIKQEPPFTRDGKSGPVQVTTDKDEAKRSVHLVEAVAQLLAERDEHAAARQQPRQTATVLDTASAVPERTTSHHLFGMPAA